MAKKRKQTTKTTRKKTTTVRRGKAASSETAGKRAARPNDWMGALSRSLKVEAWPEGKLHGQVVFLEKLDGKGVRHASQNVTITPAKMRVVDREELARQLGASQPLDRLAEVASALAHSYRLHVLSYLLGGPASYRELSELTGLKAGPLYHHLKQLRLTGMITAEKRDTYVLTKGGRNAILGIAALGGLCGDTHPISS